jgi:hypothetical protein
MLTEIQGEPRISINQTEELEENRLGNILI